MSFPLHAREYQVLIFMYTFVLNTIGNYKNIQRKKPSSSDSIKTYLTASRLN